ncbi:MAG: hypothetical protein ACRYHQ_22475 [Janthinobacterium lividum]
MASTPRDDTRRAIVDTDQSKVNAHPSPENDLSYVLVASGESGVAVNVMADHS